VGHAESEDTVSKPVTRSGTQLQIKGRYRDVIKKKMPDGSIKVTKTPWRDNRVVDAAAVLVAGLLKKDTTFTDWGFLRYAVGEGNAAWDAGSPPTPAMTQALLLNELMRKPMDYVIFVRPYAQFQLTGVTGTFSPGEAVMGSVAGAGTVTSSAGLVLGVKETTAFVATEVITGPSGNATVSIVDWSTGDPAPPGTRTYALESRATFAFADGPTPGKWLREHGLFGGDATVTADSGIIFNISNHPRIWKDDTIEIIRYFVHEISIVAIP
jgi:hypothetical protein